MKMKTFEELSKEQLKGIIPALLEAEIFFQVEPDQWSDGLTLNLDTESATIPLTESEETALLDTVESYTCPFWEMTEKEKLNVYLMNLRSAYIRGNVDESRYKRETAEILERLKKLWSYY